MEGASGGRPPEATQWRPQHGEAIQQSQATQCQSEHLKVSKATQWEPQKEGQPLEGDQNKDDNTRLQKNNT